MSSLAQRPPEPDADRPWERRGAVRRDCEPDRGLLLQWLVTCSVVCIGLVVLSPVGLAGCVTGFFMARADLQRMRRGRMDPGQRWRTEVAYQGSMIGAGIAAVYIGGALLVAIVLASHGL